MFNLVHGGKPTVEALCDHPGIKAFAFVGSTAVARSVYGRACTAGKRALCLGGAKNHLIVVPDADVELTAENVVASFTGCSGQRCMAAANLVAVGDVDHIIAAIARASGQAGAGHRPRRDHQRGERRADHRLHRPGRAGAGRRSCVDGRQQARRRSRGYWFGATVLDHVDAGQRRGLRRDLRPGAAASCGCPTLEAAIALENSSGYGNAAVVYTTSGHVARAVMGRVEAGMCGVNVGVPVPREPFGFGGWNDSLFGHGNITGWDGFRFWTRPRKVTTQVGAAKRHHLDVS